MKKVIPEDAILIPDRAKRVFGGVLFETYQWQQKMFDGSEETFEMIKRTDSVSIIPVVDDKILIIEDEQPHAGLKVTTPQGRIDDTDKSPLSAAKRELLEETGYEFNNWKLVDVVQPVMKVEWFVYVFVAWDVQRTVGPQPGPGEKITTKELPLAEVKRLSLGGLTRFGNFNAILNAHQKVSEIISLPEFTGKTVDR